MRQHHATILACTATLTLLATLPAFAADYTFDGSKSSLYVRVYKNKKALASGLSHDHIIVATGWSGSFRFDPAKPSACALKVSVPVTKLAVDPPAWRKQVGLPDNIDKGDRTTIRDHMLDDDQLHAKRYPTIMLSGSDCSVDGDALRIKAKLTIRGKSKTMRLQMAFKQSAQGIDVRGAFEARHADFGFKPYSALLGAVSNDERLRFVFRIRAS